MRRTPRGSVSCSFLVFVPLAPVKEILPAVHFTVVFLYFLPPTSTRLLFFRPRAEASFSVPGSLTRRPFSALDDTTVRLSAGRFFAMPESLPRIARPEPAPETPQPMTVALTLSLPVAPECAPYCASTVGTCSQRLLLVLSTAFGPPARLSTNLLSGTSGTSSNVVTRREPSPTEPLRRMIPRSNA